MKKTGLVIALCLFTAVLGFSLTSVERQFLDSARYGNLSVLKELTQKGVNINISEDDGTTALMWASWNGQTEMVDALLKTRGFLDKIFGKGLKVNAKNRLGATALMMSGNTNGWDSESRIGLLSELLKEGANVNAVDNDGWTILMDAARRGQLEAVNTILKSRGFFSTIIGKGVQVDKKNNYKLSALLLSSGSSAWDSPERLAILSTLLKAGASPNTQDRFGGTALMMATSAGRVEAVKILIKAKADVNIKTQNNRTALNIAMDMKNAELIQLLKDAGAH